MRLVEWSGGGFRLVEFKRRGHISASTFENKIEEFVDSAGNINALCIDFCGRYIPLIHRNDIRIAAGLLATYYNDDVNAKNEVRMVEKSE
mgnify:CR=1 FL=1|tara:strand:+ start:12898 stop:13167 length:270 start_codon:yes stop_codon:yes gene_type:complete